MPAIELQSSGALKDSIALNWRNVTNARAYFLHAMGQVGDNDMVMWSSSETADTGMGLFDYLPNATIDRWIKDKVLLHAGDHPVRDSAGHLCAQRRRLRRAWRQRWRHAAHDRLRQRKQLCPSAAPGRPQGGVGA